MAAIDISNAPASGKCPPIIAPRICTQPFFLAQLHPDEKIEPCCAMEPLPFVRHIASQSLAEIWNGDELRKFRNLQPKGEGGCILPGLSANYTNTTRFQKMFSTMTARNC
ncbi:SPASM domain-containing protein [Azonexus sp.]|uniref:SPASM domain-containing protein n=1 Tax=Azonexus sp. TaxID=1872668 RepID=UPI0027B90A31|nr:SPASM domain-containing protein [Azonexus sp.]